MKTVTTGETTSTQTTAYTYDMLLGVVTSMTDNDGNVTYYEYDNLARPTRIIYPEYDTYTAYNTKSKSILPVETIEYKTVGYYYENVIDTDETLIAQEIDNIITYYDVTEVNLTNPTAADLSNLDVTYTGAKINYCTGTGEVIESNVLDKVGDNNSFVKTRYYYNTQANTKTVVDAVGNQTVTYYDGLGREVKFIDAFDNYYINEYNIISDTGFKSLSYFVPSDNRTVRENIVEKSYDRQQRVTVQKAYEAYPESYAQTQYFYDIAGNVIGVIDANENLNEDGYTQSYSYDKLNRVISSKNANNETVSQVYDNAGNIKTQTMSDGNGNQSSLYQRVYDGEGKIVSDTDNADNSNTYSYNNMGFLSQLTDKDSKVYNLEYNSNSVIDRENYVKVQETLTDRQYSYTTPFGASGIIDVRAEYNANNNSYSAYTFETASNTYSQTGKLLTRTSKFYYPTGVSNLYFVPHLCYSYDALGNVTAAVHGCINETNQTVLAYSTFYEYDINRISKVQIDGENIKNTADSANVRYEFYADGKLKSITYPEFTDGTALKSEYVYDGLSRLATLTNKKGTQILSQYSYTYDNNGNILTCAEAVEGAQNNTAYSYDKLGRIASVSGTKGADSYYEYDYRGNRKANFEEIDFISEENAEFWYNEEDKLYYASVGNNETHIEYSAYGYRFVKEENSEYPHFYIYDDTGRLTAEAKPVMMSINGISSAVMYPVKQYIWGPDRVLAMIDKLTNTNYYYVYNGHGDVVQIIDTAGNIKNRYDYDVWGNFLQKEETIYNPFTYFGQTYDETTGLYYLRARYYDPTTGRFTQQDPAEDGYNWYVYGNQNATTYVDPTGQEGVAVTMLFDAFFGRGKSKDYSYNQEIVRTFYSSPNLNKIVNANFEKFKKSGLSSYTYSGSVSFYGNDLNPNDFDLHLAVGLANYSMTFTKETVTKRFLWKTWEETVYSVKITISDKYNFDNYREGQYFSDFLNNLGYDWQQAGSLVPYYWSVKFMKKGLK